MPAYIENNIKGSESNLKPNLMANKLTLASGLHVGKETRIGLFVAVEVGIGYGREYGIVHAGSTCKYIHIFVVVFGLLQLVMGEKKNMNSVFVSNQFHFMSPKKVQLHTKNLSPLPFAPAAVSCMRNVRVLHAACRIKNLSLLT